MSETFPPSLPAILEAAIFVADEPLSVNDLQKLFTENDCPSSAEIKTILGEIAQRYQDNEATGITLIEVASGYRFQAKTELSPWLAKLWQERTPRYSRAFLETLAIIAYKQPVTRAEIEDIRGVTVSSQIMKTLQERNWVRILGYRDLPGKPAIYGTTKTFLDYFNLKSLTQLPSLTEFTELALSDEQKQLQMAIAESDLAPTPSESILEENISEIPSEENGDQTIHQTILIEESPLSSDEESELLLTEPA